MIITIKKPKLSNFASSSGVLDIFKKIFIIAITLMVIEWLGDSFIPSFKAIEYRDACVEKLAKDFEGIDRCFDMAGFIQCEGRWFKILGEDYCNELKIKMANYNP